MLRDDGSTTHLRTAAGRVPGSMVRRRMRTGASAGRSDGVGCSAAEMTANWCSRSMTCHHHSPQATRPPAPGGLAPRRRLRMLRRPKRASAARRPSIRATRRCNPARRRSPIRAAARLASARLHQPVQPRLAFYWLIGSPKIARADPTPGQLIRQICGKCVVAVAEQMPRQRFQPPAASPNA